MTPARFALTLLCCVALAATCDAEASGRAGLRFAVTPVLVKSTGGAFVHYQLTGRAVRSTVLIAGKRARITQDGAPSEAVYDAFVSNANLRSGRSYRVRITVVSKAGATTRRSESLYLHKRFPRGP